MSDQDRSAEGCGCLIVIGAIILLALIVAYGCEDNIVVNIHHHHGDAPSKS